MKLPKEFFERQDTAAIARELLGKLIVVPDEMGNRVSGMIVETEAYLGEADRAAHSYGGRRTRRTEVMYGPGGHVYIFLVYGLYHQLNFVTGPPGTPHAILIRAVEPTEGIEAIRGRRGEMPDRNLTSGPGKLCSALAIDKRFNGASLSGSDIWLENYQTVASADVAVRPRVGIDYAGSDAELPLRFLLRDNRFVSKP